MKQQDFIKRAVDLSSTVSRMQESIDLPAFLKHLQTDPGGSAVLGALVGGGLGGIEGVISGGPGNRIAGGLKGLGIGALTGAGIGALGSVVANKAPHYKLQTPVQHNAAGYSLRSPLVEKTVQDYTQDFRPEPEKASVSALANDNRQSLGLPGGFKAPTHSSK